MWTAIQRAYICFASIIKFLFSAIFVNTHVFLWSYALASRGVRNKKPKHLIQIKILMRFFVTISKEHFLVIICICNSLCLKFGFVFLDYCLVDKIWRHNLIHTLLCIHAIIFHTTFLGALLWANLEISAPMHMYRESIVNREFCLIESWPKNFNRITRCRTRDPTPHHPKNQWVSPRAGLYQHSIDNVY